MEMEIKLIISRIADKGLFDHFISDVEWLSTFIPQSLIVRAKPGVSIFDYIQRIEAGVKTMKNAASYYRYSLCEDDKYQKNIINKWGIF